VGSGTKELQETHEALVRIAARWHINQDMCRTVFLPRSLDRCARALKVHAALIRSDLP
jgi:hypothetical protein